MYLKCFEGKSLVTGAAGFIGSHLCKHLLKLGLKVYAIDNLSTGRVENIRDLMGDENFHFVKGDLLKGRKLKALINSCDLVFHLAANPIVRTGVTNTKIDFEQNLVPSHRLLEMMKNSPQAKTLAFASTSAVYGEADVIPTPESYGPLNPISLYGASKLGCEALISAYCNLFDFNSIIYRFANVVGSRNTHGVIFDFILKLKANPEELVILGDGTQNKSYLHIEDCLDGIFKALEGFEGGFEAYNISGQDQVDVKTIAEIVTGEMGLKNVRFKFSGGPEGRGWPGDVKSILMDCSRLKALGWRPRYSGVEAVRLAARQLIQELGFP